MKKAFIFLMFFTLLTTVSSARIRHIPANFPTIQAGINACFEGDTVLIDPGTYNERISFVGTHIMVGSLFITTGDTSYISLTIINGQQEGTVVTFHQYDDYTVVLKGLTIRNGSAANGGGIFCVRSSNPTIANNIIRNNRATGSGSGGGIYCDTNSSAIIINNTFISNLASNGGGIACPYGSTPAIRDNIFTTNSGSYSGGGIYTYYGYPAIINNTFTHNTSYIGGAIYANTLDPIRIRHNTISNNTATIFGGGIDVERDGAIIDSNMITNNHSNNSGGGMAFNGTNRYTIASYNIISNNSASQDGGGIYCYETNSTISNNTINGNTAYDGAAIYCSRFHPNITDNNIIGNSATHSGGGIMIESGESDIVNNLITGNTCAIRGGGIYSRGSMMAKSNIIYGNAAKRGAAICCAWDVDTLINNTITANRVDSTGTLCFLDSSHAVVSNTICWADTLMRNSEIFIDSISTVTVRYSDIQGGYQGTGNGDLNPLFAGPLDFRLSWIDYPVEDSTKSPCIDSGDPAAPYDSDGTRADMGAVPFDRRNVGISEPPIPQNMLLAQNYPNPFNASTTIHYVLPFGSNVTLEIYDILGRKVSTLVSEPQSAGPHSVVWHSEYLPSGVYFYRISACRDVTIKRCLLLK